MPTICSAEAAVAAVFNTEIPTVETITPEPLSVTDH